MSIPPPQWSADQLEVWRLRAIDIFREERTSEDVADYIGHAEEVRATLGDLLERTVDLSKLTDLAVELVADEWQTFEALRYLSGPPISEDDLMIVADVPSIAPTRVKAHPEYAIQVVETIRVTLDRERFPWVGEHRDPTEAERVAAIVSTASLIATRRVMTARANEAKVAQEQAVKDRLALASFTEVPPREINTLRQAPGPGEFCGESKFAGRKADIVIGLWDNRTMPLECKVSNSYLNSVKRLNNDAAVKAGQWIKQFGVAQTVPAAVLAGVFKKLNLIQAQEAGLALWWSHDLDKLVSWIKKTKKK